MSRILTPQYRHLQGEVNALHVALTRNAMAQGHATTADDAELERLATEEDELTEALHLYQQMMQQTPKFVS
jgi:hypothetical protein